MIHYDDLLAEYFSADEHLLHAEVLQIALEFHRARAAAKRARARNDDGEGDSLDIQAAHYARTLEQLMEDK